MAAPQFLAERCSDRVMEAGTAGKWFRALDHARLMGVKPFYRVGDFYTVTSPNTGAIYEIRRHMGEAGVTYSCNCTAGQCGKVCWHKALVAALPYEGMLRREWKALGVQR